MTYIKLILILHSFNGAVSMTDANIGDTYGSGGFYFTSMEKCEAAGLAWNAQGTINSHVCLMVTK